MERLDPEKLSLLCSKSRASLRDTHQKRHSQPGAKSIEPEDIIVEVDNLYEALYNEIGKEQVFKVSQKVAKRASAMNIDSLLGPVENFSLLLQKDETAYIVLPQEDYHGLYGMPNAAYTIQGGKFYMAICFGNYGSLGYVVIDPDSSPDVQIIPHCLFSILYRGRVPKKEMLSLFIDQAKALERDFPDINEKGVSILPDPFRIVKTKKIEKMRSRRVFEDFVDGYNKILSVLKVFVFMKTSEVYSKEFVPDPTPTARRKKGFRPLNYISVDTTWDMNIDVNTPFPVRGHFRHQPFLQEDGTWARKLIYIEQFMKKGYHRKARKTLNEF